MNTNLRQYPSALYLLDIISKQPFFFYRKTGYILILHLKCCPQLTTHVRRIKDVCLNEMFEKNKEMQNAFLCLTDSTKKLFGVKLAPCDLLQLAPNKDFINKVSYFK